MYGKPFNPKRPFGTVTGDSRYAFDQDGQLFNAQYQPVDLEGNLMPLPPGTESKAPEREIPVTKTEPVGARFEPAAESSDDDIPEDEKPFDLVAWAKGAEHLKATPWPTVKAQAARLFEDMTKITNKEAARKAILALHGA